jgi:UDP-glucose 4-epimerase
VWRRLADVGSADRQIDFRTTVSLDEGLRQLVQWWSIETNTPVKGCLGALTS